MRFGLIVAIPLLSAVIWGGGSVRADVLVVESNPADGSAVEYAPEQVTLRFNRMIMPEKSAFSLTDRRGLGVPLPKLPKGLGPTDHLTVNLPPLGRGSYLLHYRLVATDGESSSGYVGFTAGSH